MEGVALEAGRPHEEAAPEWSIIVRTVTRGLEERII